MNFKNTNIEFTQTYSTGEKLRVGDIQRLSDADEDVMGETRYSIYTWIPEIINILIIKYSE